MKRFFAVAFVWLACFPSIAQKKNEQYQLAINKATGQLLIDGNDNDAAWQACAPAKDFYMVLPMDTSYADLKTEVRMTYDNANLYVMATCFHGGWQYMVESLRRDWNFGRNDNFIFFMDTFEDQTNGFSFGANAAGAQWDGMMYEGGRIDLSWDNKWISVTKYYNDRWVFEAAIPFKSIRYKKGVKQWGINFSRQDLRTTEKSAWAPVPRQFPTASLAYTGVLVWDEAPPEPGVNVSLIPYALAGVTKDYVSGDAADGKLRVGGDAKIALTSSLNLDLTVNPDFSQVDVDRQVTNLERFELFFPERRQFFLENGDLFGNFGYQNVRPFFSRRIGLVFADNGYQPISIDYGARLSGKLNKNWRVGGMYMKTKADENFNAQSQHFSTVAVQRRVFARSNVGLIMVNRQSGPDISATSDQAYSKYNRNVGVEYNLASSNNYWTGKALFMKSFSPNVSGKDFVQAANLTYASRIWNFTWQHEYVGDNYNAEVGFVPRKGYFKINPTASRLFFPKGTKILSHGPYAMANVFFNDTTGRTDNTFVLAYNVTSRQRATFMLWTARDYVQALFKFDPTNTRRDSIDVGTKHYWNAVGFEYASRPQRVLTYSLSGRYGGYYLNGKRFNLTGEVGYRLQPYASLAVGASYNVIELLEPWGLIKFWLISPRLDVTLTNKFFLTGFAQYNQQSDNVNLNARLQWRYKPASDFFIVYTDNYLPENFNVKNRALVVKWTYWWNI